MATAKNDVTGDSLTTKPSTKKYEEGFGGIDWSVKLETPKDNLGDSEVTTDKPVEST